MSDPTLEEQIAYLNDRIETIAQVSENIHVSNVGWMVSNQAIVLAAIRHIIENTPNPGITLKRIEFEAKSIVKNKTNFPENSEESEKLFRQSAIEQTQKFFEGIETR